MSAHEEWSRILHAATERAAEAVLADVGASDELVALVTGVLARGPWRGTPPHSALSPAQHLALLEILGPRPA